MQTPSPYPESFAPTTTPTKRRKIIIGLSVILILIISFGLYAWQKYSTPNQVTNQNTLPIQKSSPNTPIGIQESTPVVIYTEQIKVEQANRSRNWPTVRIMQKTGDLEPIILAEVGKIGEYPSSYQISPDGKSLLINLESKLQILDLETRELTDLFIPDQRVLTMSYSPDGTQLFIWDEKYAPIDGDRDYSVHRFTISNRNDEILKQGIGKNYYFGTIWREDNKIILKEAHGSFSIPYYFDLTNNQIIKTPGNYATGILSESGQAMAVVKSWTDDVCNDYSGDTPNAYNIIEPTSGEILGTIESPNNSVRIIAFSPDESEIVYQTRKPTTNREDCSKVSETSKGVYFKTQINTGQTILIDDLTTLLFTWNTGYIGATTKRDYENRMWSILFNEDPIVTSEFELHIIEQYYQ